MKPSEIITPLYGAPKPIWREVLRSEDHRNPGFEKSWAVGGSIRLFLVCGHEVSRKLSQGVPRRIRCRDCERARGGSVGMTRDLKTNLLTVEDWDPDRSLPRRTTRPMTAAEIAEWDEWGRKSDEAGREDEERRKAEALERTEADQRQENGPE